jgi:hypothetical protein
MTLLTKAGDQISGGIAGPCLGRGRTHHVGYGLVRRGRSATLAGLQAHQGAGLADGGELDLVAVQGGLPRLGLRTAVSSWAARSGSLGPILHTNTGFMMTRADAPGAPAFSGVQTVGTGLRGAASSRRPSIAGLALNISSSAASRSATICERSNRSASHPAPANALATQRQRVPLLDIAAATDGDHRAPSAEAGAARRVAFDQRL